MFCIADLDTTDNTIEVIASQFFNRKLTLHSIQRGTQPKVTFRRVMEEEVDEEQVAVSVTNSYGSSVIFNLGIRLN